MRIAYVEDNPTNLALVERVASMNHHVIVSYQEGEIALQELPKETFDLILMDVELAGDVGGLQVVRKLRADGLKTPIVAVTAYAMMGDRDRCLEAGCNDYLPKPLPINELLALLAHYDEMLKNAKAGGQPEVPVPAAQPTAPVSPAPVQPSPAPVAAQTAVPQPAPEPVQPAPVSPAVEPPAPVATQPVPQPAPVPVQPAPVSPAVEPSAPVATQPAPQPAPVPVQPVIESPAAAPVLDTTAPNGAASSAPAPIPVSNEGAKPEVVSATSTVVPDINRNEAKPGATSPASTPESEVKS